MRKFDTSVCIYDEEDREFEITLTYYPGDGGDYYNPPDPGEVSIKHDRREY